MRLARIGVDVGLGTAMGIAFGLGLRLGYAAGGLLATLLKYHDTQGELSAS
jgi:hypothetical protein